MANVLCQIRNNQREPICHHAEFNICGPGTFDLAALKQMAIDAGYDSFSWGEAITVMTPVSHLAFSMYSGAGEQVCCGGATSFTSSSHAQVNDQSGCITHLESGGASREFRTQGVRDIQGFDNIVVDPGSAVQVTLMFAACAGVGDATKC